MHYGHDIVQQCHTLHQPDPAIFMTDDSAAEKAALRAVFPQALQLLCHFHMLQAEWRWFMSAISGVAKTDRQELMKLFRNVCFNCGIINISRLFIFLCHSCFGAYYMNAVISNVCPF